MTVPAIRVSDLRKTYGKTTALAGLSFEIPAGRVTGFLGPNGAGKTTSFRSLLGLTRADSGEMEVLGFPSPQGLREITKRVGVIIEEPGLIRALTGRVNLLVAADTLGFGHDRVDGLLEFVGMTADADRRVSEYSKGMRQRLALAAAMLGDPDLLILDEPLDGLDPAGQHVFKARLRGLADEGKTVVVSSHNLSDIEALADYVVVIDRGRLVTQGPLAPLLDGGGTRVEVAEIDRALGVLTNAGLSVNRVDDHLQVDTDDGSAIVRALADAGIYPSLVAPARSSLEQVFLGLTGDAS
ncbi:MAG TPA: ABC transporter ATP-binding protein [Acidimicrobiia bacterium]